MLLPAKSFALISIGNTSATQKRWKHDRSDLLHRRLPQEGCVAVIEVTADGYSLSIKTPDGTALETYATVKTTDDISRMLKEWCEGLTRKYAFAPSAALTASATEAIARLNSFNPVQDYLRGLKWDGEKRIDMWLSDFLGIPVTDYSGRVARWFLVGMVARAMKPGVKFDYCLVPRGRLGKIEIHRLASAWRGLIRGYRPRSEQQGFHVCHPGEVAYEFV